MYTVVLVIFKIIVDQFDKYFDKKRWKVPIYKVRDKSVQEQLSCQYLQVAADMRKVVFLPR